MNKQLYKVLNDIRKVIPNITLEDNKEYETIDTYDFIKNLWISKISTTLDKK
jgi:hypothetical protein